MDVSILRFQLQLIEIPAMHQLFPQAFSTYNRNLAPFLHQQYNDWYQSKPLQGLRILHHVPLVQNTLLKIACLAAAGAEVTVTNPDFMSPCPNAITALRAENIRFAPDMSALERDYFDIYLDCGAVCYQTLGVPRIGAIELTGSGDAAYRQLSPACPVISIDRSLTKQLETVFGMAESALLAITSLTNAALDNKNWMIFGFGKIGRGIAYLCSQHGYSVTVIDTNPDTVFQARELGLRALHVTDASMENSIKSADIIVTATGGCDVLGQYAKSWFEGKMLVNMGILDEFGPRFANHEILNAKQPINFVLSDPTPIEYIDAEMYAHNQAVLSLLSDDLPHGMHDMQQEFDNQTISRWCQYHSKNRCDIDRWFIRFDRLVA